MYKLFHKNSTHASSLVMNSTSILILTGIVIVILLAFFFISMESSQNYSSDQKCITLLSRLDEIKVNQDDATIQTLIKQSCAPKNISILNKKQFSKEFELCNSKAQELVKQETFLSELRTQYVCFICSSVKTTSINYEISTRELLNEVNQYSTIEHSIITLNNHNEENTKTQQIFFHISPSSNENPLRSNNKITFKSSPSTQNRYCSSFLNS